MKSTDVHLIKTFSQTTKGMPSGIRAILLFIMRFPSFLLTLRLSIMSQSNLSPVTVSLFHTNKPFQKQLLLTPERISIATLHDSHAPLFTKCLESDIVARCAGLTLELPCVGKRPRECNVSQGQTWLSWLRESPNREDVLQHWNHSAIISHQQCKTKQKWKKKKHKSTVIQWNEPAFQLEEQH